MIFIYAVFTDTLNKLDIQSGIGEMLHFYLVSGRDDFEFFREQTNPTSLVKRCLEIKKGFIEIDEFDKNERLVLNYGHTFGHAIETMTNYEIPHGIAVCMGMDIANYISMKKAPERMQALKLLYEDEFKRAADEDGERTSIYLTPQSYYPSG